MIERRTYNVERITEEASLLDLPVIRNTRPVLLKPEVSL